ncbi:RNA polymerase sigma factor [Lactococcus protaetiae]|uniref:RNA polymerase sigma factor n=1 Tax=Lactococcus protaetiae TaxID=2592653 RepID=A0A514Z681_9LACT|nr:RNA polymerase sigma factor [Lactococcus protaetiae]MCL2114221.1 RNA polymerase sigma factor [Streptococcaceae bacterium]QDK70090.1 RNA polymerase sigma factor [Lactococcus protaetiae]
MNLKKYETDINQYATEITKYLISRGSNYEDAQDTVQDTLVKMISLDIFIPPDKLRAWMYRVAIRKYINTYNRNKHYQTLIQQLSTEVMTSEFLIETSPLPTFLEQLPPYQKQLLTAYYYKNYSTKQLADMFDISLSKVKIDLYRARKKLKKILEKEGYDQWSL